MQDGLFSDVDEIYKWTVEGDKITTHSGSGRNLGSKPSTASQSNKWKPQALNTNRTRPPISATVSCNLFSSNLIWVAKGGTLCGNHTIDSWIPQHCIMSQHRANYNRKEGVGQIPSANTKFTRNLAYKTTPPMFFSQHILTS